MTYTIQNFVAGAFQPVASETASLYNPSTEAVIAKASARSGLDAALRHARQVGGPALRSLTFKQRAEKLKAMVDAIVAIRDPLIEVSVECGGNTRGDAKFDIDGATSTLQFYAQLGESLGDAKIFVEGEPLQLARNPRWVGHHAWVPQDGAALHINAFNFPAWNMLEKAAVALLAGVPVVTKPALPGSLVAARIVEAFHSKGLLADGTFQIVHGSIADQLGLLTVNDSIAFTGSSATAQILRVSDAVVRNGVRLNVEADSLNSVVLGPDVQTDGETYRAFLRDTAREITQKAGQKCTAIRRIFIPTSIAAAVTEDLRAALRDVKMGDPTQEGVRMGPVASAEQHKSVLSGIAALAAEGKVVADPRQFERGYFVTPTLIAADANAKLLHEREVFGPVATVLAYDGTSGTAATLAKRGQGSLQGSIYSDDGEFVADYFAQAGAWHGRIFWGSEKVSEHAAGPGAVLASLHHGGPGRAGGGSELGGLEALKHYGQRVAVQGSRPLLSKLLGNAAVLGSSNVTPAGGVPS